MRKYARARVGATSPHALRTISARRSSVRKTTAAADVVDRPRLGTTARRLRPSRVRKTTAAALIARRHCRNLGYPECSYCVSTLSEQPLASGYHRPALDTGSNSAWHSERDARNDAARDRRLSGSPSARRWLARSARQHERSIHTAQKTTDDTMARSATQCMAVEVLEGLAHAGGLALALSLTLVAIRADNCVAAALR